MMVRVYLNTHVRDTRCTIIDNPPPSLAPRRTDKPIAACSSLPSAVLHRSRRNFGSTLVNCDRCARAIAAILWKGTTFARLIGDKRVTARIKFASSIPSSKRVWNASRSHLYVLCECIRSKQHRDAASLRDESEKKRTSIARKTLVLATRQGSVSRCRKAIVIGCRSVSGHGPKQ